MTDSDFNLELLRRRFKSQTSTVHTRKQQAVCVRRAYKKYGSKKNSVIVLDRLSMTVPKGCIYGLLGASGCGKTTLLNCIVGRRRINSGEIWVLGGKPGSKGSGVPGPRVGYMPQEVALYDEFTIAETLKYFGWISNMTTLQIKQKVQFCTDFLKLPDADQRVKTLSGGQQRRVSLAAALIHEPELLILDEPTVGVDPVLRASIWDYLIAITKHGRTTVIITTHYIEEARKAHLIGLMRGGYFLAEESPERLIIQFNAENLEDVFLQLSVMQNHGKRRRSSLLSDMTENTEKVPDNPSGNVNDGAVLDDETQEDTSREFGDTTSVPTKTIRRVSISPEPATEIPANDPELPWTEYMKFLRVNHLKALVWKNFLWMWRNFSMMAFIIGLPLVQMALFCIAIGHDPVGLKLSVVNREIDFPKEHCKPNLGCNSTRLSCNYLEFIAQNYSLILVYKTTEAEARRMVETGQSWAMLIVQHNFSDALRQRLDSGRDIAEGNLYSSTISVFQDQSNQNIGQHVTKNLLFGFWRFIKSYLSSCDVDPKVFSLPLSWQTPIYGYGEPDFTNFAAPGVIVTIIFFMSIALTSGAMLMERNAGILERCLVNGITGIEVLCSLAFTQFLVMLGQSVLVMIVSFFIFNLVLEGSLILVFGVTVLSGICGMCYGFVVACACDKERTAIFMALGSFLPIIILCGIVWPIEGMNEYLRMFTTVLPLTQVTESLRSIQARGFGISHPVVYNGFISLGVWIALFLTISILLLKFKKG